MGIAIDPAGRLHPGRVGNIVRQYASSVFIKKTLSMAGIGGGIITELKPADPVDLETSSYALVLAPLARLVCTPGVQVE